MKKRIRLMTLLVSTLLVALMIGRAYADDLSLYSQDLYDSDGYNYGVDFYVNNNTGADLYAVVYITSRENVNGDCVYGMILLAPNETGVRVGSFIVADDSQPWSVYVQANYGASPEQVEAPPY
jgi:hypothetical protein